MTHIPTYYLFGEEVVNVYQLNYDPSVIAYLLRRNAGTMEVFTHEVHPSEIISAYDGWGNWIEISEHEFNEIESKII
jgi:hypothetical protein